MVVLLRFQTCMGQCKRGLRGWRDRAERIPETIMKTACVVVQLKAYVDTIGLR